MENAKDLIVNTALELLSKYERLQTPQLYVTASEVADCMRVYKGRSLSSEFVAKVLDGEFASKFDGKRIVYFLRIKN